MKKAAFTLIELLVVISIIAILASLAIPAYSKVMEKGRAVQDASNLKQLGLGVVGYANDNNDTIFISGSAWAPLLNGTSGTRYVPAWKVFQSPFDKRTASELGDKTTPVSYDVNTSLSGSSTGDVVSPSSCILMSVSMSDPTTLTFALNPTTALGTLSKTSNNKTGVFNGGIYLNVLFADSHVAQMRASDFCNTTNKLTNSDASSTIKDLRWNSTATP